MSHKSKSNMKPRSIPTTIEDTGLSPNMAAHPSKIIQPKYPNIPNIGIQNKKRITHLAINSLL
jgi:hypothetical protein